MKNNQSRRIIHFDMDAFYASVEIRDNSELKGKPVIVGAMPGSRGVVSTCSYEARKYGIHSAMSINEAYRRCPDAVFIRPNLRKYSKVSKIIQSIVLKYSDKVEFLSLDEGYLDITHTMHLFSGYENVAKTIKKEIFETTQLTCSVGVGYNMLTAKLASEEKKPDGFFMILNQKKFDEIFLFRPISILSGVGKKMVEKLKKYGVYTISDLRKLSLDNLVNMFGQQGENLYALCRGIDKREVNAPKKSSSISKEMTFQKDISDKQFLLKNILHIIDKLEFDMKNKNLLARTITLKIKYANMKTITRSKTLVQYTNSWRIISLVVKELLNKVSIQSNKVRLVGVKFSNLIHKSKVKSILLNNDVDKISNLMYKIRKKYGINVIQYGEEVFLDKIYEDKSDEKD